MQCGSVAAANVSSAEASASGDFTPGIINFESLRNSSGVMRSRIGSVTAIPGNFDVNVAHAAVRKDGETGSANWPE